MPVTLVLATAPGVVSAGVVSFFADVFAEEAVAREVAYGESGVNSQNVPLLQAARNIDPNPARGGGGQFDVEGGAIVPAASLFETGADVQDHRSADEISIYVVREGDYLGGIAEMFRVSPNTIRWANDLSASEPIHEGQVLVILPINGVRHEVKKGDTIESIAKEHKGDIEEILQFNGLESGAKIAVGQTLTIPGGEVNIPEPSKSSSGPVAQSTPSPSASVSVVSGYFAHPLGGLGQRTQGIHGYNGVDIGASVGTAVRAAASGQVIISRSGGWNGGYGNYVVIKHPNGTQTLYAHLSSTAVYGGNVSQGQVIGYVGNTGRSTGPHLHFEVRGARNPF